jgi:hypothetical protein
MRTYLQLRVGGLDDDKGEVAFRGESLKLYAGEALDLPGAG